MIIETEEKRPNSILLIIILFIFLITLGILVYYIKFQTSTTPKANNFNTAKVVSISNSYVFASPVRAKAGGDLIRVNVFVLDDQGDGLYDQKVILQTNNNSLEVKEIQSLTDETGKAVFDVSSDSLNTYTIGVFANGILLPQSLRVVFD